MIWNGGHFQNFGWFQSGAIFRILDKAKNLSSKKYYTICDVIGNEKTPRHFGIHTQLQQYRYRDGVRSLAYTNQNVITSSVFTKDFFGIILPSFTPICINLKSAKLYCRSIPSHLNKGQAARQTSQAPFRSPGQRLVARCLWCEESIHKKQKKIKKKNLMDADIFLVWFKATKRNRL